MTAILDYIREKASCNLDPYVLKNIPNDLASFPQLPIPGEATIMYFVHGWGDSFFSYIVPDYNCILFVVDTGLHAWGTLILLPLTKKSVDAILHIPYDDYDVPDLRAIYDQGTEVDFSQILT